MNATLYNAFAYENVRLEDSSGRGKLEVEFTASWPQNVRYYAALAEYEDAATLAVKGYVIPDRGVQFEIKPGQALPDGATPPDFYEEGEGLMTWRNVIADNGPYDHDRQVGVVTFRVASIRAEAQTTAAASGGSGCSAVGAPPFALLLGVPLLLLRKKRP
jgi:Synergist-CTERM protein sorting domain-containing protein